MVFLNLAAEPERLKLGYYVTLDKDIKNPAFWRLLNFSKCFDGGTETK